MPPVRGAALSPAGGRYSERSTYTGGAVNALNAGLRIAAIAAAVRLWSARRRARRSRWRARIRVARPASCGLIGPTGGGGVQPSRRPRSPCSAAATRSSRSSSTGSQAAGSANGVAAQSRLLHGDLQRRLVPGGAQRLEQHDALAGL